MNVHIVSATLHSNTVDLYISRISNISSDIQCLRLFRLHSSLQSFEECLLSIRGQPPRPIQKCLCHSPRWSHCELLSLTHFCLRCKVLLKWFWLVKQIFARNCGILIVQVVWKYKNYSFYCKERFVEYIYWTIMP